ncbi:hypothetical protein QAD02_010938 [Eretmocerus hayati]|uniref:Uncharacterized protein n=1 Tax=Eretmocerus hayati TaxID=131215 RepID=A0ACC2NVN3_9HYME|nr:hypothetical protein QAD02_010938 [Eretmocerus hayati]
MVPKAKVLFIILISIAASGVTAHRNDFGLKVVVDYMRDKVSPYEVTVISKSPEKLGCVSNNILRTMIDEFSSAVVDMDQLTEPSKLRIIQKLWFQRMIQSKFKIGIIELDDKEEAPDELLSMLNFFMEFGISLDGRGRSIIFLINGNGQSLEQFLRYAWSYQFLDLTVIEYVADTPKKDLILKESSKCKILYHIFDPFNDRYQKDSLTGNTNILPKKLVNMQGYTLCLGVPSIEDKVSLSHDLTVAMNRVSIFEYAPEDQLHILSEMLNSTILTHVNNTACNSFFATYMGMENGSETPHQDFDISSGTYSPLGIYTDLHGSSNIVNTSSWTHDFANTYAINGLYLCLNQRSQTEVSFSKNFLVVSITLSAMELIFIIASRILKLDKKYWSASQIARALMGGSMSNRQQGICLRERILLVTIYFVSIVMMTLTTDELIKMSLNKRVILRFKTLKELADSNVDLRVQNKTKRSLSMWGQYNPTIQKIARQSTTNHRFPVTWSGILANGTHEAIYAYTFAWDFGIPHVETLDEIWFATRIDEIVGHLGQGLLLKRFSPFKARIENFFIRFREFGLEDKRLRESAYNSTRFSHWIDKPGLPIHYPRHNGKNDKTVDFSLNTRLAIIILLGTILACIALIGEIIENRLVTKAWNPGLTEFCPGRTSKKENLYSNKMRISTVARTPIDVLHQLSFERQVDAEHTPNQSEKMFRRTIAQKKRHSQVSISCIYEDRTLFRLLELDNAQLLRYLNRNKRIRSSLRKKIASEKINGLEHS